MALSIDMERSYKLFTDLAVNRYLFKRSCNYRLSPTSSTFIVNHQVMSTDLQSDLVGVSLPVLHRLQLLLSFRVDYGVQSAGFSSFYINYSLRKTLLLM